MTTARNKEEITMARKSITRIAAGAVVTGIATLALATPANAIIPPQPPGEREFTGQGSPASTPTTDEGWTWQEIVGGTAGGVALAGIGVAAAVGLRRRNEHLAHPV